MKVTRMKYTTSPEEETLFDKRIWRIKDVAAYLQISVGKVYNKTSKGEIPYFKKGKALYFHPEEIENWVMEGNL